MGRRNWSIRSRILALVLPPTVMFVVYWLIGTAASGLASWNLLNSEETQAGVRDPGAVVVTELQRERRLTAATIAGRADALVALREQRNRTDAAVTTYRRRATAVDSLSDRAAQRIAESATAFDGLRATRAAVDSGQPQRIAALAGYDGMVDAMFRVYQPLMELDDPEATRLLRAAVLTAQAREQLARQDTILTLGRFSAAEQAEFGRIMGVRRHLLVEAATELDGAMRTRYAELDTATELIVLETLENSLASGPQPGVPLAEWTAVREGADRRLLAAEGTLETALDDRTSTVATLWYWRFGLSAVIGLLSVVLTIAITIRVGSSLIRRLRGLRRAALDLADDRLPGVVLRLRHGETVDVATEAPELEFGNDEIGQVGHAFSAAQRTAVESAIQEARVRAGLNEVFLNIARRSQTLLHRQLTVLDRMERRTTDPQELEDLFRLDHLATRMRRHAEDLVILAGSAPGRGWREPVPLVDVVRGAVSEVEDYPRVQVLTIPDAALAGRAVTDLLHLLAELIENATSFSPPHTKVNVVGQLVPNGFALEIEDRGLGMTDDEIAEANARLRRPPDFDPANSARLGLFVVALLAARLGAQVTLRSSPFGGITAVVLVPPDLVVDEPAALPAPTRAATPASVVVGAAPALPAPSSDSSIRVSGPAPTPSPMPPVAPSAVPPTAPPAEPPAETALDSVPPDLTEDGLPKRVRRSGAAEPPSTDESDGTPSMRPPEQTRAMMSAFQSAVTRGRRDADAAAGTVAGTGADSVTDSVAEPEQEN